MSDRDRPRVAIAITGASGLLGRHISAALLAERRYQIRRISRSGFADEEALDRSVAGCDVIVHCAGISRGVPEDVELTNVSLVRALVAALARTESTATVVFADSIQRDDDTAYGRSKSRGAEILDSWAASAGGGFVDLVIPNAFGEGGRPFYNSFVSTFCHQLARSEEPQIIVDKEVELVHAQDVARAVAGVVADLGSRTGRSQLQRLRGEPHGVTEVLGRLRALLGPYSSGVVPEMQDPIDVPLFNTLRSYLFDVRPVIVLPKHGDGRGHLVEVAKSHGAGQTFYSLTHPGIQRGNHFHLRKLERFVVLEGNAVIKVRRLFERDVLAFEVSGEEPVAIDMPTLSAHSIENIGTRELLTMFWASEIFDPDDPDTFAEPVDA